MKESILLVAISQLLIGTGFSFLYMQHVRVAFETRTNIAQLTQLEREALLRREDALHYTFYKTITAAPDFWSGYEQLKNATGIEYPKPVNVLQRFYVLPELAAGYLFHLVRTFHNNEYFPIFSCWYSNDMQLMPEQRRLCDRHSFPMQFYLEFVWLMGGIALLVVYIYGTLLSENIFGGVYGIVSYVMFHNFAAKIYERPAARENFAFPLISLQMFCICLHLKRISDHRVYRNRIMNVLKLTALTAGACLSWQFSAVIFATQIIIVMALHNVASLQSKYSNAFTMDYALSQLLSVGFSYWFSHHNKQFLYTWQLSLAFSLFLICAARAFNWPHASLHADHSKQFLFRTLALELFISSSAHTKLIDVLNHYGVTKPQDNAYTLYGDLCAHWTMQIKSTFVTNIASCNPLYAPFEWSELWPLIKTLILKPYCMYGVVMLGMFFRKWRKSSDRQSPNSDAKERARKYLLEDFLEENRISIQDMSQRQTEDRLNKCYKLLEACRYNYDLYKIEKAKLLKSKPEEHNTFIDDVRRLKAQIHKNCEEQRKEQQQQQQQQQHQLSEEPTTQQQQQKETETKTKKPSKNETEVNSKAQTATSQPKQKPKIEEDYDDMGVNLLSAPYIYSFIQMAVFTFLGLLVKKLFFLSFTQGCILAPTICSKIWYRQHRNIFWSVTLIVFIFSMFDTGVMNVRQEYYPSRNNPQSDEVSNMLEWIQTNTERNSVFAGPIEIIGTVHLTTGRSIVHHAHLEMRQISDRTEHVYSVYSRQQANDIYNQYSQLKTQYLIVDIEQCKEDVITHECDILSIWDDMQPSYRKYPQFCSELLNKNVPSFVKVFTNADYIIIKMFTQTVQISLRHNKMPEMVM